MKMILGDFTEWCKSVVYRELDKIINRFQSIKTPYWILIITKPHYTGPTASAEQTKDVILKGNIVNVRYVIIFNRDQLPAQRQVGTALMWVNNRTGETRWVYVLPSDMPFTQPVEFDKESEFVGKSAQGIPGLN